MSKPYMDEYRSTNRAKMKHTGVQGEFPPDKAKRIAKGFADGGAAPQPKDLYSPEDLKTLSSPKNMGGSK